MNIICRGLLSTIIYALFVAIIGGCKIHADNPVQKERTHVLLKAIRDSSIKNREGESPKITGLPSYHKLCSNADPIVPHSSCLNLVVEAKSVAEANDLARDIQQYIEHSTPARTLPILRGSLVVVTAVSRQGDYSGDITPYSFSRNFIIGVTSTIYLKD